MKSSEILRAAARRVAYGHPGLFSATNYATAIECERAADAIDRVLPEKGGNVLYEFSPADLPQDVRETILCLAAAIAESEGD